MTEIRYTASTINDEQLDDLYDERDRLARLARDRADRIVVDRITRIGLRARLADQEAETMRQHGRAREAEAAIARVRALADDMRGSSDTRWLADQLTAALDGAQSGPAATQATEETSPK
ncbi:hypothetical protein ACWCQN_13155 [Streptomyces sp. NPDC001984]